MRSLFKLIMVAVMAMLSLSAHAQLFFHKDGFYEKTNNHWTEYQITKEDDKNISEFKEVGNFEEYNNDENYYYVDNNHYKVAIPKSIGVNFYIIYPNQENWDTLYKRDEFHPIRHSIQEGNVFKSFSIYADGKAALNILSTKYIWANIPEKISFNDKFYVVDKIEGCVFAEKLESIILPWSIKEIVRLDTSKTFSKKLKEIIIPGSVDIIGDKAPFGYNSALEKIVLIGSKPIKSSLFFGDMPNLKIVSTLRPIEGIIWVNNSPKFKKVENESGKVVVVQTYLEDDPKYF